MDHTAHQLCSLRLPEKIPVMVLDDCYLFPGCYLPLFIFEERYRRMLATALDTDRMFCIGSRVPESDSDELLPVTTAAIIRACRRQDDGTSHVMLYGVSRIRYTGWLEQRPFKLAAVESFPTYCSCAPEELDRLKADALASLPKPKPQCSEGMQAMRTSLLTNPCPEMACDILAYHFIKKPLAQRALLMEPDLAKRFRRLIAELKLLPTVE